MNISALKSSNYELFLDGVSEGAIDYSHIDGVLPVGAGQPNPIVTSFLGGPYLPVNNKLHPGLQGSTLGASGNYPRPFLSYSQHVLTNGPYTNIGPYGRLINYKKQYTSTCINDACGQEQPGTGKSIWGRVGNILSGYKANTLGFFVQPWYLANDGQYDAAFWAERYNIEIPDKPTWWDQCAKSTIIANLYNDPLREPCEIEVAIANFQFDDDQYYKGEKLHSIQDGSLGLLPILTGIASTVGWI